MIELDFVGPISVSEIDENDLFNASGLYLWTVKLPSGVYKINYLGETGRPFFARTKEHIVQQLGGNYRIWDADALSQGHEVILWDGMWQSGAPKRIGELIRDFEMLAVAAKKYLEVLRFFVAPIECEPDLRKSIEWAIGKALRESPTGSSLLPDDIRYRRAKTRSTSVRVVIRCSEVIDGLPTEIEI